MAACRTRASVLDTTLGASNAMRSWESSGSARATSPGRPRRGPRSSPWVSGYGRPWGQGDAATRRASSCRSSSCKRGQNLATRRTTARAILLEPDSRERQQRGQRRGAVPPPPAPALPPGDGLRFDRDAADVAQETIAATQERPRFVDRLRGGPSVQRFQQRDVPRRHFYRAAVGPVRAVPRVTDAIECAAESYARR